MDLKHLNDLSILILTDPKQLRDEILDRTNKAARFTHIRLADGSAQVFDTESLTGFLIDPALTRELDFFSDLIYFGLGTNREQIGKYRKIFKDRLPEAFIREVEEAAKDARCDYELIH